MKKVRCSLWICPRPSLTAFLQFPVDHPLDVLEVAFLYQLAVDKHRGGSADTCLLAFPHISQNEPLDGGVSHVPGKSCHIETQHAGNVLNLCMVQTVVVLKQSIVKLPEFSLPVRRKGSRSGRSRKFVIGKRKIPKNKLDFLGILVQHLLEQRLEPRTVESLIVAEDGNGNRGSFTTLKGQSG